MKKPAGTTIPISGNKLKQTLKLTPEEQRIVDEGEWQAGRPLTRQEINLHLAQAETMGEIPKRADRQM
jgi:hypothetical protein